MRVWAIGFKQHTELRAAMKKPKAVISEAIIPPYSKLFKTSYRFKQVHHKGGKVLTVVKGSYVGGLFIGEGECVELPPHVAKSYLRE